MSLPDDPAGVQLPPATTPLAFTGERFVPSLAGEIMYEHIHRYLFALQFCAGKDVLDVASGEGYGTYMLSLVARSATGVEVSAEAVAHAREGYARPHLAYCEGSATALPLADASVDVVVSFETIEHLEAHDTFLREIRRVLRAGGLLVMSSPDKTTYSPPGKPPNPFHVRELTQAEFKALVGRFFANAAHGLQKATGGSWLLPDGGQAGELECFGRANGGEFVGHSGLHGAIYLIAVASDAALPPVRWGLLDDPGYTRGLIERNEVLQREVTRYEGIEKALSGQIVDFADRLTAAEARAQAAETNAQAAEVDAAANRAETAMLRANLDVLAASRSWAITRPLREVAGLLRSFKRTRSVRALVWESGKLLVRALPAGPRERLRALRRRLAPSPGGATTAALGADPPDARRADPDNPRVATAVKRLLGDLAGGHPAQKISHLVVVNHFKSGGADLTAANYLRFLAETHGPASCLLVLADAPDLTVPGWLPPGVRTIRIDDYVQEPSWRERLDVLQGLVQATGAHVLHTVNSVTGWNLIIYRGADLARHTRLFGSIFAFQFDAGGQPIGYAAEFFERARPHLAGLLTDNARLARDLGERFGLDEAWRRKVHVVYNPSRTLDGPVVAQPIPVRAAGEPLRVLWAGRVDAEKLPEVLQAVSEQATFAVFDVWGSAVVDERESTLRPHDRLRLRGAYSSLGEVLAAGPYDAFLFTSKWEGLPNVLLEIGALGIPLIAPDVGGVGELVTEETGYLVKSARDVSGYIAALEAIRRDPAQAAARATRLAELIRERHTWTRFSTTLRAVPDYA